LRKLGIIGGTSWHSTALYYDHINRGVAQRLGGLHSARLVIESLDLAPYAQMEMSGDWDGVAKTTLESEGEGKNSRAAKFALASRFCRQPDSLRSGLARVARRPCWSSGL